MKYKEDRQGMKTNQSINKTRKNSSSYKSIYDIYT